MSLPVPATTEQIEATRAWVRDFYNGTNSSDITNWITQFYQPNGVLNFANSPSLKGHEEIISFFEKQHAVLSSIKHDILHVDVFSDRIYIQQTDTYIVKNDPEQNEIIIKAVVVIWKKVDENNLSSLDVYLDPTPLKEKIKIFASK